MSYSTQAIIENQKEYQEKIINWFLLQFNETSEMLNLIDTEDEYIIKEREKLKEKLKKKQFMKYVHELFFMSPNRNKVYYAWFYVNLLFFHWMAWRKWDALRSRFFLSYFFLWILLGTLGATIFSSAGPVYYEAVVGDAGPYGLLVSYLQEVGQTHPLTALRIQELLWAGYTGQLTFKFDGISAMPSLHVALPVLLTFVAYRLQPWVGIAFGFYSLLILIGSVHLAWHYAVDGYASIVAVPFIWALSGWAVRKAKRGRASQ